MPKVRKEKQRNYSREDLENALLKTMQEFEKLHVNSTYQEQQFHSD
jgi:hypothetical protein